MAPEVKVVRLSEHMTVSITTEAMEALQALAAEETRLVMLSVDPETEVIHLVPSARAARPSTVAEMVQAISATEPRFTFCRLDHGAAAAAGRQDSALLFFFTFPSPSGALGIQALRNRMVYPLMKRAVLEVAGAEAGLSPCKRFEVEDVAEIDEDLVLGELKALDEGEPSQD